MGLRLSITKAFKKGKIVEDIVVHKIVDVFESVLESKEYVILRNIHFLKDELDSKVSTEEDIILMHPVFGVKLIQVKSKNKPVYLNEDLSQIKHGEKVLHNFVDKYIKTYDFYRKKRIKRLISTLLVYPNLSASNLRFKDFIYNSNSNIIFKEDFEDDQKFIGKLLYNPHLDDKYTFKDLSILITNLLSYAKELDVKVEGDEKKVIIPVITANQIVFFDKTQQKIVKQYKKGIKIVRGLAGTGKTFIVENLVKKLSYNKKNKLLVLTFNSEINKVLYEKFKKLKNVEVLTFFLLAKKFKILKGTENFNKKIQIISKIDVSLWKNRLNDYKNKNSISYIIIDESQDIPKNFLKAVKDTFENAVIFVDEAQATYDHSITNINKDIFGQSKLGKKVANLYTIYRVPSKIMRLALDILLFDKTLPRYFKNVDYIDIPTKTYEELSSRCIFQGGNIEVYDDINKIRELLNLREDLVIFVPKNKHKNEVRNLFGNNAKIYTYESVKGLEFSNILLYKFPLYISILLNSKDTRMFRKLYVIISRASNSLTIHWDIKSVYTLRSISSYQKENIKSILDKIYEVITKHEEKIKDLDEIFKENEISLPKACVNRYNLSNLKQYVSKILSKISQTGHMLEGTAYIFRFIEETIGNIF